MPASLLYSESLHQLGRADGMPHGQYLGVYAVSSSGFKALRRSPAHFKATADPSAEHPDKASTPQQFAGTLLHCALLEPGEFPYRYPTGPDAHRASKAWKDWAAAQGPGAQPVTPVQADTAQRQAASLRSEPNVAQLFGRAGANEVSYFWRDAATGLLCKARADRVIDTPAGAIIFDAKTAADASRVGFARSAANFYYHTQAAWYMRGWRAATGADVAGFVFGVVETEFPYMAAAYMLDDEALAQADVECTRLLAVLANCEQLGHWPGYPDGLREPLALPPWTFSPDRIA